MTKADLENYSADLTPMELYDAIGKLRFYIVDDKNCDIPKVMQALNCLYAVIYDDFKQEINEEWKKRYPNL